MRIFPSITSKFWLRYCPSVFPWTSFLHCFDVPPVFPRFSIVSFSRHNACCHLCSVLVYMFYDFISVHLADYTSNRVLRWCRHKNVNCEIMEFIRIFWKNNIWKAYLPKTSIVEKIVPFCSDDSIQILLNLTRFLSLFSFFFNLTGVHGVVSADTSKPSLA